MRTEKEIRAKMAESLAKAKGYSPSRAMYWQQQAGILRWILEPPKPVISDEGRRRAHERANAEGKPIFVWANSKGTHVRAAKPDCRCEVIEPPEKPLKRNQILHVPAEFKRKAE